MSTTFRTAVVRTPSGPDSIEIIEVPVAEPGPGQIRVELAAAAVNPVDLALAGGLFHGRGLVHQPHHTGLGWDFAGTVAAVGPDVDLPIGSGPTPRADALAARLVTCLVNQPSGGR